MAEKKPTRLAIGGKIINVEKIDEKSLAQFRQQLKQNGITVEEATSERLYLNLRGELTPEQKAAKEAAEAKAAAMKAAAESKCNK